MKKFYLILSAALFFVNLNAQENKSAPIVAVTAIYNLENLFDTIDDPKVIDEEFLPNSPKKYNTERYANKLANMSKVLSEIGTEYTPDGAALIGVVEVENQKVLEDLCATEKLKDRNYKIVHYESRDARGIDVALIYNPRYFEVLSSRSIPINLTEGFITRDILYVKGLLFLDTIHVFVNHWPSRRGGSSDFLSNQTVNQNMMVHGRAGSNQVSAAERATSGTLNSGIRDVNSNSIITWDAMNSGDENSSNARKQAAQVLAKIVDSINNSEEDPRVLIMGDFNDDPSNASIADILGAKGKIKKLKPKELYNPFYEINEKGYGTLGFRGKWNLFDQQIFSAGFLNAESKKIRLYKSHIFLRDYLLNSDGQYKGYPKRTWGGDVWLNGYSDHLPTYSAIIKFID